MPVRVIIVQHADKERRPGDPGLTDVGHEQATAVAAHLGATERPRALLASPSRRARETAAPIGRSLRLEVAIDERLRERMSWEDDGQTFEQFLGEWRAATDDRELSPSSGDSSRTAAARFLAALDDIAEVHPDGSVVAVSHGGVTTDLLRTLLGDDELLARVPTILDDGVPCAALTRLRRDDQGTPWVVEAIADRTHMASPSSHRLL